jgi:hypothetical protein
MADTVIKRHPIRGFLYGIFFGLGLVMLAVGQGWVALGTTPPFILFIVGLLVGTLWGMFGPAKKPKGQPPAEPVEVEAVEPEAAPDEAGAESDAAPAEPAEAGAEAVTEPDAGGDENQA